MSSIVTLGEEKVHFLSRFAQLNEQEILHFSNGNFDNLESFYNIRENLLAIIQYINAKITALEPSPLTPREKEKLVRLDSELQSLTQRIIEQDSDILTLMDSAKTKIIKELQSIHKNKKSVSSYKTKVDHRQIDEKA